jgi:hypothetical protein
MRIMAGMATGGGAGAGLALAPRAAEMFGRKCLSLAVPMLTRMGISLKNDSGGYELNKSMVKRVMHSIVSGQTVRQFGFKN